MPQNAEFPLVSVVIPAYNSAAFIGRALDSALAQAYPAREILVVDDGSCDETPAIVEGYVERSGGRVRLFRQENAGPDPARNLGIREARGEFVAFLDSDDEWLPGRLEKCVRPMIEDPEATITWCLAVLRYPDGREEPYCEAVEAARPLPRLVLPPATHATSATTCRRSALLEVGCFDRELLAFADHDLWARVREAGKSVHVPEALCRFHYRPGSRSRKKDPEAVIRCYLGLVRDGLRRRPDLYEQDRPAIEAEMHHFAGRSYYALGEHGKARRHLLRSLRRRPTRSGFKLLLQACLPPALMRAVRNLRGRERCA